MEEEEEEEERKMREHSESCNCDENNGVTIWDDSAWDEEPLEIKIY